MISKADWQAVHDRMSEEERRRLGPPPTAEEVGAYLRGELAEGEAARVRALLVAYPELARTLTTPFPTDDAEPGDADYLSDEQIGARWETFRTRRLGSGGRVLQFWQASAAIAAALAIAFGVLLWKADSEPRVGSWNGRLIVPGAMRGGMEDLPVVGKEGESFVIALPILDARRDRVTLLDEKREVVWRSGVVQASEDNVVAVYVPAGVVKAGRYVVTFGGREYFVRVAGR
jgi:hypothetical protein